MVEHVSSNRDGTAVLIAGSDQNDYTDAEPVVLIDSTSEPTSLVEESTAIDDWGEAPAIEIDAENSMEILNLLRNWLELNPDI